MWWLILIAVHVSDPADQPAKVELLFPDQRTCESALSSMRYQVKFTSFKVTGECKKQS